MACNSGRSTSVPMTAAVCNPAATEALRGSMRAARTGDEPFFDRGPGYAMLSGGAAFNEFDLL